MTPSIKIDDFENLHLRIKTVGYPNNGESIMVSLMDKDKELYNVFIDSYDVDGYQYWESNLPKETRVDAFIWTHPDTDHSLGVNKLLTAFDSEQKASIFLPTSITEDLLVKNEKEAAIPCYSYLKDNYNKGRTYQWNEVSLWKEEEIRYFCKRKIVNRRNNDSITFQIGFLLPNSAVINRRVDMPKMNGEQMNDLSLFFIIELNKVRYLFTGDLSEINIKFLEDDYLSRCRFIKIPHHGSKDPIKLIDKIQHLPSCKPHSVTTVFGSTHPFDEVLDKYAEKCKAVYSTGRGDKQYGLVDIDYYVMNLNEYTINLEGNAEKVR